MRLGGLARLRGRSKRIVLASFALGLLAINALAYRHAWSMTHFTQGGEKPPPPEAMSLGEKARAIFAGVSIPKPRNAKTPADYGLPFEIHRFPSSGDVTCEAWRLPARRSQQQKQAPALCLMFHGFASSKASLLPAAQAFRELGCDAVLVDFRGSGESDGCETTIGYREADDVVAACRYARRQWPDAPLILYGRSMGAAAALRAIAIGAVEPRALILECPFNRLLVTTKNRFRAAGLPSFPAAELLVFWGGVQHGYWGFEHNPVDYASAVACPTLFLHGDRDIRVTADEAREVFDRLPAEKTWALIAGAGHERLITARPHEWRSAVEAFLSGLER